MSTWEERMSARHRSPEPPKPTEPPGCCFEWFLDGSNGWLQRLTHPMGECSHAHHSEEVWTA